MIITKEMIETGRYVSNKTLREYYNENKYRLKLSKGQHQYLRRTLGIEPDPKYTYKREHISYNTALKCMEIMGADPWEVGL